MADLVKILGDGKGGWNLTTKQAEQLHAAGKIVAPTITALKNHFLNKVLIPRLQEIAEEKGLSKTAKSSEISKLRDSVPQITVNGNEHNLISLNKLWTKIKTNAGKPLGNASSYLRDDYRTRAGKGFDQNSLRLANFYDDIDNLRAIRDRDLVGADANKSGAVYQQFDRGMEKLFRKNRKWLPKVNNRPIEYSPLEEAKYGWQEGKNREGFLDFQSSSYDLSQDQSRWLAKKLGIKQDAGHVVPLGGMIISDAERQRYFIDKSELEPNPDGEGWLLRGTNSLTNLAIEDAKGNRAKGNLSGRQLEEIIAMNTAFTKSRSLLEYNLSDDKTFRKLPEFSAAIQGLFGHGNRDINELQAIAENQILQTGVQITPTLSKSQLKSQKGLAPNYRETNTLGPLKTTVVSEAGGILSQREDDTHLLRNASRPNYNKLSISNALSNTDLTNMLSIGPDFFDKARGVTKAVANYTGAGRIVSGVDSALTEVFNPERDPNQILPSNTTSLIEQPLNYIGATTLNKPDLGSQVKNLTGIVRGFRNNDIVDVISSGSGLLRQESIERLEEEEDKDKLLLGN